MTDRTAIFDPVADLLDDMAALGAYWARNRESGRTPGAIRTAMILVARDLLALSDAEGRKAADLFGTLAGPDAYARNNGQEQK